MSLHPPSPPITTTTSGTTYAGYVGLLTGVRLRGFSISVDERWTPNGTIWDNVFEALFAGGQPVGFFLRDLLGSDIDFETALNRAATQHLISVMYIIMGGQTAGEGAVVTRNRDKAADVWRLDAPSRWFLVETNYDHWKPVPPVSDLPAGCGAGHFFGSR